MQPFLQSRLERYARRLGELDFLLSREDIMGDMGQYRLLSREHAEVTQIAGRYARWQQCNADLAGAREMLHDPDMAEMAQEEVTVAQADEWRQTEIARARKLLAKGEDVDAVLEALSRGLTQKMLHGAMAELRAAEPQARERASTAIEHFFLRK